MKNWKQRAIALLCSEDGPTIVEYAVLLALIVGMMVAAITYVGNETKAMSDITVNSLQKALD
jgi:Flp pilus assembly pilin Flp